MDDDFSLNILYDDEYVPDELYKLVQHGSCSQLDIRLNELSNSIKYLTALRWYGEEQLSLLMVAALNGNDDIVRVLFTHCNPIHQVELKGRVNISGVEEGRINGATALYCACYRGHFTVAKTLIELGTANVNQDTYEYPSYPLFIHATIMNRRDIVQFLLENKYADVNETKSSDRDECTAIIWAAFRGHTFLVEYLIANGADVNYSCENENLTASTALACAAIHGHIDSVRVLYNAGADINIKNRSGDTLLTTAVKHKYYSIINFLLEKSINTIEDVELAACSSFEISSSIERMQEVLELLKLALQQRELLCIPKVCVQSMDIYDNKQECQTIDELDDIKNDSDRIFIETLLIRERIGLSRNDIKILKPLHDYGDRLAHRNEFDKCINVWIHMFYIYQQMKISTMLHRFVWIFCRMLTANQIIPVERFLQVCRLIFEPSQMEEMDLTLCNALFLVIIATKILDQQGITDEEKRSIYHWIRDFCRLQLTTTKRATVLHLCVDVKTNDILSFRPRDTSQYLKFPNESGLQLILACGSRWLDIDAIESTHGNTPLHIICANTRDRKIIELLLNAGCHMDCVNKYGRTPVDYIKDKETRDLLTPKPIPSNLKCLCARIIAKKQLNTECLRSTLNKFIIMHGGGSHIQSSDD